MESIKESEPKLELGQACRLSCLAFSASVVTPNRKTCPSTPPTGRPLPFPPSKRKQASLCRPPPHQQPSQRPKRPSPGNLVTLHPGSSNGLWLSQPRPPPPSPSSSKSPSLISGFACGPPLLVYPGLQSLKKLTFAGEMISYVVIRVAGQAGPTSLQKL